MDLSYGPEYEAFRQDVRKFIETNRESAPRGGAMKSDRVQSWQKLLIEKGYTARTIPQEYGGHGGEPDIIKARIIGEEFAHSQTPGGLGGQGISMLVPTLLELGTEEQKKRIIPPRSPAKWSGAKGIQSPTRAATSRAYARRQSSMATNGSSMALRSGLLPRTSLTGFSVWSVPSPKLLNIKVAAFCYFKWILQESKFARSLT